MPTKRASRTSARRESSVSSRRTDAAPAEEGEIPAEGGAREEKDTLPPRNGPMETTPNEFFDAHTAGDGGLSATNDVLGDLARKEGEDEEGCADMEEAVADGAARDETGNAFDDDNGVAEMHDLLHGPSGGVQAPHDAVLHDIEEGGEEMDCANDYDLTPPEVRRAIRDALRTLQPFSTQWSDEVVVPTATIRTVREKLLFALSEPDPGDDESMTLGGIAREASEMVALAAAREADWTVRDMITPTRPRAPILVPVFRRPTSFRL